MTLTSTYDYDYSPRRGASPEWIEHIVDAILAEATLGEKIAMLSGRGFFQEFVEDGRLWGPAPIGQAAALSD